MDEKNFIKRLRELRDYHGYSQKELAEYIEIPYNSIIKYETGDRKPNFETIIRLANFYNTSVDYLMGRTDFLLDDCDDRYINQLLEAFSGKVLYNLEHVYSISKDQINLEKLNDLRNSDIHVNSYLMIFGILVNIFNSVDTKNENLNPSNLNKTTESLNLICEVLFKLLSMQSLEPLNTEELSSLSLLIDKHIGGEFSFKSTLDLDTLGSKPLESKEENIQLLETYINLNNTNNQKALNILKRLMSEK